MTQPQPFHMKQLLQIEELFQFLLALGMYIVLGNPWWSIPLVIMLPDVSILGYLINPRIGALTYNIGHHRGVAIGISVLGYSLAQPILISVGLIMYAHASMDRVLGYGLKYPNSFWHTHLGVIGKTK